MADDSGKIKKNYEDALKAADKLVNKSGEVNELLKSGFDSLTATFISMAGSQFFKEIEKTPQDIAESAKKIMELKDGLKAADQVLSKDFANSFKGLSKQLSKFKDDIKGTKLNIDTSDFAKGMLVSKESLDALDKKLQSLGGNSIQNLEKIKSDYKDIASEIQGITEKDLTKMIKKYEDLQYAGKDFTKIFGKKFQEELKMVNANFSPTLIRDFVESGGDVTKFLEKNREEGTKFLTVLAAQKPELLESLGIHQKISQEIGGQIVKEGEMKKSILSTQTALKNMSKNLLTSIRTFILSYDDAISKAQTNTGILFKENNASMSDLASKTASLGMNIGETTELMGEMSDKLHTTDFSILSKAAGDFAVLGGALGVTTNEISTIAGEMMIMGSSSETVKNSFKDANISAKLLGVSSRRVVQQIEKNITKMREFGFTGGVKSLQKMSAEAERLGFQVDEIFNVAKRARNIEGAMEMAAELQRAGGSFSSINPMDLLSAARKGPEELGKILTTMGGDIGKFAKNANGEMEFAFDPVDVDRLQIVADSTGMSLDALQKTIKKNAEDNKKLQLIPASMFDFDGGGEDAKKMIAGITEMGKNGEIKFKADAETTSILEKAGVDVRNVASLTKEQIKTIKDETIARNSSLEAQNAKNASFNEALERLKNSFMAIFSVFEPAVSVLAEAIGKVAQFMGGLDQNTKKWGGIALMLTSAFFMFGGKADMLMKGFGSLKSMGAGILGKKGGGVADMASKASGKEIAPGTAKSGNIMTSLAEGFKSFGKGSGQILKGALTFVASLAIIAGGMAVITGVISHFGGPEIFNQMMLMGVSLLEFAGAMTLMSYASKMIDTKGLLTMALAMGIIGLAMIPFAHAASMMKDINFTNVLLSLGLLTGTVIALGLIGTVASAAIPGVAIMGALFLAVSASLLVFSFAAKSLSEVDWASFSQMGTSLMAVIPGMMGFGLASLAFANPASMLGLILLTGTLIGLTAVMVPLASSLSIASNGFAIFASNMGLMADAVTKFDVDKFERIANASEGMATASISSQIGNFVSGLVGGNQGSTPVPQVVRHEVVLKLNGRDLQTFIIEDTKHQ